MGNVPLVGMTGLVVGGLYVVERAKRPPGHDSRHAYWTCLCTCGRTEVWAGYRLRRLAKTGPVHLLACGECASKGAA